MARLVGRHVRDPVAGTHVVSHLLRSFLVTNRRTMNRSMNILARCLSLRRQLIKLKCILHFWLLVLDCQGVSGRWVVVDGQGVTYGRKRQVIPGWILLKCCTKRLGGCVKRLMVSRRSFSVLVEILLREQIIRVSIVLSRQVVLGPSARRPQWDLIVVMVHLTPNRSCLWAICGLTGSLFTVVKAD